MSRKILFLSLFLALLCACSRFDEVPVENKPAFSVEEARMIYERDLLKRMPATKGAAMEQYYRDRWMLNLGAITPQWFSADITFDEAFSLLIKSEYQIMTFDIESQNEFCVLKSDRDTGEENFVHCDARLLITKGGGNLSRSFILFFIPDKEYFYTVDYDYTQIDTYGIFDYSGLIIFTNLDGTIIRGHRYLDGELCTEICLKNAKDEEELLNLWYDIEYLTEGLTFVKAMSRAPSTRGYWWNDDDDDDGDNDDTTHGGEDQDFEESEYDEFTNYQGDYIVDIGGYIPAENDYDYILNYGYITPIEDTEILHESICVAYRQTADPIYGWDYEGSGSGDDGEGGGDIDPDDINGDEFFNEDYPENGDGSSEEGCESKTIVIGNFTAKIRGEDEEDIKVVEDLFKALKKDATARKFFKVCAQYQVSPKITVVKEGTFAARGTNSAGASTICRTQEIKISADNFYTWPLFEEILHCLQYKNNPDMSLGLREFEAKCLEAVLCHKKEGEDNKFTSPNYPATLKPLKDFYENQSKGNYNTAVFYFQNRLGYDSRYYDIGEWDNGADYCPTYKLFNAK